MSSYFPIDHKDDLKLAKEIILNLADENKKILKRPKPFVGVGGLGENSINLIARFWCANSDFPMCSLLCLIASSSHLTPKTSPYPRRSLAFVIRIKGKTNKFDLSDRTVFLAFWSLLCDMLYVDLALMFYLVS